MYRNTYLSFKITIFILSVTFRTCLSNSCNFNVKLNQILLNDGFHRNITYYIVFDEEEDKRWMYEDCTVSIDQTLPAGVFTNPDEIGDLKRLNRLNAEPKNRINVELPAEQSSPNSVYVISNVIDSKVYMWLPVHARYHQAVPGGGMARNIIDPPKLYLRCPDERLDVCGKAMKPAMFLCNGSSRDKCSWRHIHYTLMTRPLVWDVPVGNTDHYYIVSIGTTAVIVFGSIYLLRTIHYFKIT